MGYKTHLLEIYTLPTTLTPHFFYLCYSLKPTARGEWLGYISEGWRDFLLSIDPKPEAVRSCTFSGYRSGPLEWFSVEDQLKSRKLPGLNVFSEHNSEGRRGFPKRIDQKSKAVWNCTFSGHRSGPLGGALRSVWKGSRRQSGMNIFSRHISEG